MMYESIGPSKSWTKKGSDLIMMHKILEWGLWIRYRQESQRLEARPLKVDVRRKEL
jgi:hypothetical protein